VKTAVEWLYEQMPKKIQPHYKKQLEQAKEMEKQQSIAFAKKCIHKALESDILMAYNQVEQYYNETFKQEQ
jgi:hypothetical protein